MSKNLVLMLACVLIFTSGLSAQEKNEQKTLKNADIVVMSQTHIDDDTLIKLIGISATDFDLSRTAVLEMRKQGVSAAVLRAMLQATQLKKIAAEATTTTTPAAASGVTASAVSPSTVSDSTTTLSNSTTLASANAATASSSAPPSTISSSTSVAESPKATAPEAFTPTNPMPNAAFAARPGATAMMGMSPQQMAMMQSQMASMGPMMSGLMGGMTSMSYSAEQMPHVYLLANANHPRQQVSPSIAQIAQSKFKGGSSMRGTMLRSLATEGLSFAAMGAGPAGMMAMSAFRIGSGFMPGMRPGAPSLTYVWGLPGHKSSRELSDPGPMFELSYGDIPGVDPDGYEPALVKLVQSKDNYRLVGATQTKLNSKSFRSGLGPESGKWISEERWPIRIDKEERGFYILHVDQPLEPGEYAVVLRPVKGYKAAPSGFGGGAQVFYSAWDFSVPGEVPDTNNKRKKK